MSFGRRRQLTEEETRIYAAGMAAARRGECKPKQELPFEQWQIWNWGWKRVGRGVNRSVMRSRNHHTLAAGMHMIRTEVDTLDDALKLIDQQQRKKKAAQTLKAKPQGWRQQLGLHNGRKNSPVGKAVSIEQADRISEFERHIVGRVVDAIRSLKLGVEEMSVVSAVAGHRYPAVNPKSLMDVIVTLSHLIKQDVPNFAVQRLPVHAPLRRCISCGAELANNVAEYCLHCDPATEHQRVAAQLQREHYAQLGGIRHEVNQLEKLTYKISRRVIDHDGSEGHGGHSSEVAGGVESGERAQDVLVGGEAPHQLGASGTGDDKG